MLNLCTKNIVLICDVIWLNKTYGEYISRQKHIKPDIYILQYEYYYDKWDCVKIDPVKTTNIKNEKNVRTD